MPFHAPSSGGGLVVQRVDTITGAVASGTNVTPSDDTIPQNTESNEFMTLAITPKATDNRLIITVTMMLSGSAANSILSAIIFQDTTAGALASSQSLSDAGADKAQTITVIHTMDAGTTSSTTFKAHGAANVAGTCTFNGIGTGRQHGGVMASSIVILEVES
jgi:hypothetical protein